MERAFYLILQAILILAVSALPSLYTLSVEIEDFWSRSDNNNVKGLKAIKINLNLPLRVKIVLLIAGALTASLSCYLYIGTSLIIQDKTSYIYEHNLTQLKAISDAIEGQVQRMLATTRVLGHLIPPVGSTADQKLVDQAYNDAEKLQSIDYLAFLRVDANNQFIIQSEFGQINSESKSLLTQLGWTPESYNKESVLVGPKTHGKLPIGGKTFDSAGQPLAFIALIQVNAASLEDVARDAQLYVLDSTGSILLSKVRREIDTDQLQDLKRSLVETSFSSGAREITMSGEEQIVGYKRFVFNKLMIISLVSKQTAFMAAQTLRQRSLFLGVSILLFAIGITLVFVKTLTRRLHQLWTVTQKVAEGDFSCRVNFGNTGGDEITGLADSFNTMAKKIDELMVHTAEKARMEKELETAQFLQNRFFPTQNFEHENISVAGKSVSASECGGDWWFYAQIHNYLIVVIGDVTGHGVSAALLTASAHGAFSILTNDLKNQNTRPSPAQLVNSLNEAILASAGKETTMTFLASVIDLDTAVMSIVNASHRPPYLYRKREGVPVENAIKHFKPLTGAQCAALGLEPKLEVEPVDFQLEPGDMVFWYTDGLLECKNPEGKMITKQALTRMLLDLNEAEGSSAQTICTSLMDQSLDFFGEMASHLEDDITVVVGTIPRNAQLLKKAA